MMSILRRPFPSPLRLVVAAIVGLAGLPAGVLRAQPLPTALPLDRPAPDSFYVTFETTRGPVVLLAHRAWSPHGVDRLYHLASSGYYRGAVIYRVGPTASYPGGFVVQFGLSNDSAVNRAWRDTGIPDEPVRERHRRGTVMFARGGPNSRTVELAVDLSPNSGLDTVQYQGVTGFPPIAEVVEGMAALDALERRYGNEPLRHEDSIMAQGSRFLDRAYPGLDRIRDVRVSRTRPRVTR